VCGRQSSIWTSINRNYASNVGASMELYGVEIDPY
jgi:hypothetical protein